MQKAAALPEKKSSWCPAKSSAPLLRHLLLPSSQTRNLAQLTLRKLSPQLRNAAGFGRSQHAANYTHALTSAGIGWLRDGFACRKATVSTVLEGFASLSASGFTVSLAGVLPELFVGLDASSWKRTLQIMRISPETHAKGRSTTRKKIQLVSCEVIGASSSASAASVFSDEESGAADFEEAFASVAECCWFREISTCSKLHTCSHVGWDRLAS